MIVIAFYNMTRQRSIPTLCLIQIIIWDKSEQNENVMGEAIWKGLFSCFQTIEDIIILQQLYYGTKLDCISLTWEKAESINEISSHQRIYFSINDEVYKI